jgi:hypothetical protein
MDGDNTFARALLAQQRKRLLASTLGAAETAPWWVTLTPQQRSVFRDKMIASVNTYYEFCLDLIVAGGDVLRSDDTLALLHTIHASQLRVERGRESSGGAHAR